MGFEMGHHSIEEESSDEWEEGRRVSRPPRRVNSGAKGQRAQRKDGERLEEKARDDGVM